MSKFTLNGKVIEADVSDDIRLLFFLREDLGLTGTKYGCGVAACGACTVHVDGEAQFACQLYVVDLDGTEITTIEGLSDAGDHPLQKAWVAEQVPQCGYCQSGQIMRAATLLASNPSPSRDEIRDHMRPNLCRCGTYATMTRAIERAAREA
ncbi:(2Fe-2S)-binding protein [Yoonia sp. SS1-5]|uniref:(2Fe-2S)-binding protein n=1 Tax=Yoonia rhodophyticola TaxID=3137370 RepID=A0AAN0MG81_9RHOB